MEMNDTIKEVQCFLKNKETATSFPLGYSFLEEVQIKSHVKVGYSDFYKGQFFVGKYVKPISTLYFNF